MNTPVKRILITVFLTALLSLSCSLPASLGNKIKQVVENATIPADNIQSTALPAAETAIEAVQGTAITAVESDLQNLANSVIGNNTSQLDSYRTSFSVTSSGTDSSGNEISQIIQMESEILNTQFTQHTTMQFEGTGTAAETGTIEMYEQNGQTYLVYAANTDLSCLSVGNAGDLLSIPYLVSDDLIQTIETGSLLESNVTINQIATDHYAVQNAILDEGNLNFQSGEVWVARDGSYIVRFIGQADGEVSDGTNSSAGIIEWVYNLYDVSSVTEIVIPEACLNQQSTLDDIPLPGNATGRQTFSGIITFESPDKPELVGDYYRETLAAQGWVITDDMITAGVVMLTAEKDNKNVQIMITSAGNSGSSVIITTITLQ